MLYPISCCEVFYAYRFQYCMDIVGQDASRLDQGKPRPLEDFTLKSMWLFDKCVWSQITAMGCVSISWTICLHVIFVPAPMATLQAQDDSQQHMCFRHSFDGLVNSFRLLWFECHLLLAGIIQLVYMRTGWQQTNNLRTVSFV